ncbi:MAG: hypothetical protein U5L09_09220 [Bacteroidales bacterium]|nr:hypothetical protein [Bacteroidales bacterium]
MILVKLGRNDVAAEIGVGLRLLPGLFEFGTDKNVVQPHESAAAGREYVFREH